MQKWKEKLSVIDWPILIPAVFLSFTFCVFGPIEIYMTNIASFPFQIGELALACLFMFLCSLLLFSAITLLFRRRVVVTSLIFGLALAVYIQGNWMFVNYGEMDGTAVDWEAFGAWPVLNSAIWLVLIICPVILSIWLKNKATLKKCMNWIAVGVLMVQFLTLGTLAFTTTFPQNKDYYVARDEYMLKLSNKKNIVVMLFDGFQSSYFQQILNEMPEAQVVFEDFVFFDNAVGTSLFSQEGAATILTGNQLLADLPFQENIDYIYENSEFFPALEKNGYDTRYYESTEMVSGLQRDVIKNIREFKGESIPWFRLPKLMSRITAFRYMPHVLKQYFWFSFNDIDALKTAREVDIEEFHMGDHIFNQDVLSGKVSAELKDNAYRFYYFKGVHPPFDLDENGEYTQYDSETFVVDYVEDIHENPMMYQQALGSVRIMQNFIRALKSAGIYEKTDIIITADHGWENRYNPILLIKCQDTVGEFSVSHAPVSYISDFGPTVLSLIDDSYPGKTIFDYSEDEDRERSFYIYSINPSDRSYNSRETWYIDSLDVVQENFYVQRTEAESQYQINDDIIFTDSNDGRRYFLFGTSAVETNFAWSLGTSGRMLVHVGEGTGDLTGEFQFKRVYAPPQRLVIRCDDLTLYDAELSSAEAPVQFAIPEGCIEDGLLILDLEYPDAVSPKSRGESGDTRELAFAFENIRFYHSG